MLQMVMCDRVRTKTTLHATKMLSYRPKAEQGAECQNLPGLSSPIETDPCRQLSLRERAATRKAIGCMRTGPYGPFVSEGLNSDVRLQRGLERLV